MTRTTRLKSIVNILRQTAAMALVAGGLAGCDRADEASLQQDGPGMLGPPALYGHIPTLAPDDTNQPADRRALQFAPQYHTVAYLQFDGAGHLIAKHAFFENKGTSDDVRCAIRHLMSKPEPADDCAPYDDTTDSAGPIFQNFDGFKFGRQQRIHVYLHNSDVAFNDQVPISFTPYGAFDVPKAGDSIDAADWDGKNRNLSFYNAKVDRLEMFGVSGSLLSFRNYFRGKDGGDITSDGKNNANYSLNLNLRSCRTAGASCDFADPTKVIPLAIDPDTGNGWGNQP